MATGLSVSESQSAVRLRDAILYPLLVPPFLRSHLSGCDPTESMVLCDMDGALKPSVARLP